MAINDDLLYEVNENGERIVVKSVESLKRAYLRFTNITSRSIDVWWRDFEGLRQHYLRLQPGGQRNVDSYLTHPWEFTDASTKERYVINNKYIFRAPNDIGEMLYHTNWKISVGVRTLRNTTMLTLATLINDPELVSELNLPGDIAPELKELINIVNTFVPIQPRVYDV